MNELDSLTPQKKLNEKIDSKKQIRVLTQAPSPIKPLAPMSNYISPLEIIPTKDPQQQSQNFPIKAQLQGLVVSGTAINPEFFGQLSLYIDQKSTSAAVDFFDPYLISDLENLVRQTEAESNKLEIFIQYISVFKKDISQYIQSIEPQSSSPYKKNQLQKSFNISSPKEIQSAKLPKKRDRPSTSLTLKENPLDSEKKIARNVSSQFLINKESLNTSVITGQKKS